MRSIVLDCLEARSELNGEEEMIDVVGGGKAGMRGSAKSEGFTFMHPLRRSDTVAVSDPEIAIHTSRKAICK